MKKLLIIALLFSQIGLFAQEMKIRTNEKGKKPLIVLSHDGKQYMLTEEELDAFDPISIKSINVFKGESAMLYGEKAKDGVVLISLKDNKMGTASFEKIKSSLSQVKSPPMLPKSPSFNINSLPEEERDGIHSEIEVEALDQLPSNMLIIVVYDKKLSKIVRKGLDEIPADIIKSLSVYKDYENKSKFDAINKEGVVLIQLKQTKAAKKAFRKLK